MNPAFVRKWILPRMMRRTWPRVTVLREELEDTQWLSRRALEARTLEDTRSLLEAAARRSPWYRRSFRAAGVTPADLHGLPDLARFPVLEKHDLRDHLDEILLEGVDRRTLTQSATGGTTGEPTRYYWDDEYWCRSSAASIRAAAFMGFEPGDRHTMIWGTAFHASRRAALREKVEQRLKNVLVVPGFELSRENMGRWARRVARQRPRLVEGYASLLVLFAGFLKEEGITDIRPHAVVSSAEKLHDFQRALLAEVFAAPVYDRYGSREVGCIGHECERRDGLHVNVEHVHVEIVRDGRPVPPGESGEVLVTSLSNRVFPFIRYRIGDMGALRSGSCSCGRGLPLLDLTEGRVHDLLTTARGTWLPGEFFPHLFKEYPGVRAFQVHQSADGSVEVRIVKGPEWTSGEEAGYRAEIAKALGEGMTVRYRHVDAIERTGSGKLRFTSSEIPVDPGKIPRASFR